MQVKTSSPPSFPSLSFFSFLHSLPSPPVPGELSVKLQPRPGVLTTTDTESRTETPSEVLMLQGLDRVCAGATLPKPCWMKTPVHVSSITIELIRHFVISDKKGSANCLKLKLKLNELSSV